MENYSRENQPIERRNKCIIVDFNSDKEKPDNIDLTDLDNVFEICTIDSEKEDHRKIREHLNYLLKEGLIEYGNGQVSTYSIIDSEKSRFPRITDTIGVRQVRTVTREHTKTKEKFKGIFSTKEKPRPLDDFMRGVAIQSIAYLKNGVNVPKPCFVIEHLGAKKEDGGIIEGTEDIITGASFIMEHIPGLTPLQICDPDGKLKNSFMSVREIGEYGKIFARHDSKIKENILKTVENNPYLLEIDFTKALEDLKNQIEILHSTKNNIPGILHCDLHEENIVLHPNGVFYMIDFDQAKIAYSNDEYGKTGEDYIDYGKTIGGRCAMYMPDCAYEFKDPEKINSRKPIDAISYLTGFIKKIVNVLEEIKKEK